MRVQRLGIELAIGNELQRFLTVATVEGAVPYGCNSTCRKVNFIAVGDFTCREVNFTLRSKTTLINPFVTPSRDISPCSGETTEYKAIIYCPISLLSNLNINPVFAIKGRERGKPLPLCRRNEFFERLLLLFRSPHGRSVELIAKNKSSFVLFFNVFACGVIEFPADHAFEITYSVIHFPSPLLFHFSTKSPRSNRKQRQVS